MAATYGDDCISLELDLADRSSGFTHGVVVVCRSGFRSAMGAASSRRLDLCLKFSDDYPAVPPVIAFHDSNGLSVGDLLVLEAVLERAADDMVCRLPALRHGGRECEREGIGRGARNRPCQVAIN